MTQAATIARGGVSGFQGSPTPPPRRVYADLRVASRQSTDKPLRPSPCRHANRRGTVAGNAPRGSKDRVMNWVTGVKWVSFSPLEKGFFISHPHLVRGCEGKIFPGGVRKKPLKPIKPCSPASSPNSLCKSNAMYATAGAPVTPQTQKPLRDTLLCEVAS